jgi:dihydroorotase-like cyclic amidohydrolase
MNAGAPLSLETCPHYLWLCDEDFGRLGNAMKIYPPVRTARDRDALVDGLAKGVIGIVATDHAPHTDDEKAATFDESPAGSPGVQTLYVSCLELARRLGNVWQAPHWVSEAPAVLAGLQESKGTIAPGYDADIVIIDPNRLTLVRPEAMRSRQRHSALGGMDFGFSVREVYLRGAVVERDGRRVGRAAGRMVRPARDVRST